MGETEVRKNIPTAFFRPDGSLPSRCHVNSFSLSQALVDKVKVPLRRVDTALRAIIHIYVY